MSTEKPPKDALRKYLILSGIAFEMGAIIFLAAKAGIWLDAYLGNEKKVCTAILTMLGVSVSLVLVLRQIKRLKL